ncbi:lipopolysaccharide biosynthesis protein [Arthrobacter sp. SO3]|uniref:lipopolysaccharide biosynthesis protein n=1 Tax=Arthrobacter sp. SO3 TaxID=1897057 RepID=UPI001CFF5582|nr:lipopolysaccharide biosynthesis protein [Arthrobacter sp. SO3]MCB5292598.1 Lipopolysaccharide biosynthesis protein WzxC [Arthrobacter sp. SO3]
MAQSGDIVSPAQSPDSGLETVRTRLRGGIVWGAVGVGSGRVLQFVTTLILARILAPEHFGALAVALVVQTIALNITELGATAALARGDRDAKEIAPTIFTIGLVTSAFLTGAVFLGAPALAAAMGDPAATPVVQIMAFTVLLAGLSGVPAAMVWRDYLQRPRALVEVAGTACTLVLVIPMALDGWGAFALAWSRLGGQLFTTAGYWLITPQRFRPGFDRRVAAYVLRLGMPLAMANLVVFATLNLDYIVVGRELGAAELGVYLLAFNLASLPSSLITAVIRTVAVPTFGRLHRAGRLAAAAPGMLGISAYLALPVSALLVGLAEPLIRVLYGQAWAGASVAMIGLGIFGAGRILTEMLADLCVGAGRTGGLFWVQVAWFVTLLPALLVGASFSGLAGVGAAQALVVWLVVLPIYFLLVRNTVGAPIGAMVLRCLPPAVAAAAAGLAGWLVANVVGQPLFAVIAGGPTGAALYLLLTRKYARQALKSLRTLTASGADGAPLPASTAAPLSLGS